MNPLVFIPLVGFGGSLFLAVRTVLKYAEPHLRHEPKERWVLLLCIFAYLVSAMPMWLLPIDMVGLQLSVDACARESSYLYYIWNAVYWTNLVTAYFTNDFARCYVDSGGFSMRRKALLAWREVRDWYLYACAFLGLVLVGIVIKVGFNFNTWLLLLDVAMALANVYAVAWFIFLLGFAIHGLPRRLWDLRSPVKQLNENYYLVGSALKEIEKDQRSYLAALEKLRDTGRQLEEGGAPGKMHRDAMLQVFSVWKLTDKVVAESEQQLLGKDVKTLSNPSKVHGLAQTSAMTALDESLPNGAGAHRDEAQLRRELERLHAWASDVTPHKTAGGETQAAVPSIQDELVEIGEADETAETAQGEQQRTQTEGGASAAEAGAPGYRDEGDERGGSQSGGGKDGGDGGTGGNGGSGGSGDGDGGSKRGSGGGVRDSSHVHSGTDSTPAPAAGAEANAHARGSLLDAIFSLFSSPALARVADERERDPPASLRVATRGAHSENRAYEVLRDAGETPPVSARRLVHRRSLFRNDAERWDAESRFKRAPVSLTEFENLHRELRQVAFKWRRANKLYASAMRRAIDMSLTIVELRLGPAKPILGVDDDRSAPLQWFARGADGRVRLGAAARRLLQRAVTRLRKALCIALIAAFCLLMLLELGFIYFFGFEVPDEESFEGLAMHNDRELPAEVWGRAPLRTIFGNILQVERGGMAGASFLFVIIGGLLLCCAWALRRIKLELLYAFRMESPGLTDSGSIAFHSAMLCRIAVMLAYNVDLLLLAPDTRDYLTPQTYFYCLFAKKARLVVSGRDYYLILCPLLLLATVLVARFDLLPRFQRWQARRLGRQLHEQFDPNGLTNFEVTGRSRVQQELAALRERERIAAGAKREHAALTVQRSFKHNSAARHSRANQQAPSQSHGAD